MRRSEIDLEHWQHIVKAVNEALALPAEEREAFLADAFKDDLATWEKVTELLASDEAPQPLPARDARIPFQVEVGMNVGPYRIDKELGSGGMGAVYLGTRTDDINMRVAIKILKPGMNTGDILHKFHRERSILAGLKHPHIAGLYDGGTTTAGLPYFVMEYVEGEPITSYCDKHKLRNRDRLKLFIKVCEAVSYAHQNLIIHRDLKPANILVTERGEPKLLDFGIAGLLDPATGSPKTITHLGFQMCTPEYASPEQLKSERLTAAGDVYSLGVLLYELLTGYRPYRVKNRSGQELFQAVCEQDPERASTAITKHRETFEADGGSKTITPHMVSSSRGDELSKIRRGLKGDLDNILMKALRKEPVNRYPSVEGFSDDIQRHLKGQPIHARPQTFLYRTGKFLKRSKGGVATALVFLTLLLGFTFSTLQQKQQIAVERDLAKEEKEAAERVTKFLKDLFEVSNPSESMGKTVTAKDILDRGAQKIQNELKDTPKLRARMMSVIGEVYANLGLHREGCKLLAEALSVRQSLPGENSLEVAESKSNMAWCYMSEGDNKTAERNFREALDIQRQHAEDDYEPLLDTLWGLGMLLYQVNGDFEQAESLFLEGLDLYEQHVPGDDLGTGDLLGSIGRFYHLKGERDKAKSYYRRSIEMLVRLTGPDDPYLAYVRAGLGSMLHDMGETDGAAALFREAIKAQRKQPEVFQWTLVHSLNNLAVLLHDENEWDEALELYREASRIDLRFKTAAGLPPDSILLANQGSLLKDMGLYEESEQMFRRALLPCQPMDGDPDPTCMFVLSEMADLFAMTDRVKEGERLAAKAFASISPSLPKDHFDNGQIRSVLGVCLARLGRYQEAEPLLEQGFEILRDYRGLHSIFTRRALQRLLVLYEKWGKPEREAHYRELLDQAVGH